MYVPASTTKGTEGGRRCKAARPPTQAGCPIGLSSHSHTALRSAESAEPALSNRAGGRRAWLVAWPDTRLNPRNLLAMQILGRPSLSLWSRLAGSSPSGPARTSESRREPSRRTNGNGIEAPASECPRLATRRRAPPFPRVHQQTHTAHSACGSCAWSCQPFLSPRQDLQPPPVACDLGWPRLAHRSGVARHGHQASVFSKATRERQELCLAFQGLFPSFIRTERQHFQKISLGNRLVVEAGNSLLVEIFERFTLKNWPTVLSALDLGKDAWSPRRGARPLGGPRPTGHASRAVPVINTGLEDKGRACWPGELQG